MSPGTLERPVITSLRKLAQAEAECTRCPLYRYATQVVPGEGKTRSRVMFVGEQPGDQEDRQGRPFVGPAGGVLDRAVVDAGIERSQTFVTNAVKHFKHEMRGKRRLHKRPNAYEIDRCKIWLDLERLIVKPRVVIALGATAARSLFGRPMPIEKSRGKRFELDDGSSAFITQHPSALLRIDDAEMKRRAYKRLVADLRRAARYLAEA
jgi:DNA polymerase